MLQREDGPSLSVIICTYNRASLLIKTLRSLLLLDRLKEAEVIVVDNRSTDETPSVVGDFIARCGDTLDIRYVLEPVQGLSAARNNGILSARSELIAFLDDDAIPERTWLSTILETFESQAKVMAMGGLIHPLFETERPAWLIPPFELPLTIVNLGNEVREYPPGLHPCGANMAMRKTVFDISLFPLDLGRKGESLISGEESWVFEQIRKKGHSILYHPQMAVQHFIPAARLTEEWMMRRYYSQGMSNAIKSEGFGGNVVLLAKTAAKAAYVAAGAVFARSQGRKMLNKCRLESIRGTLHVLRGRSRSRESAAG